MKVFDLLGSRATEASRHVVAFSQDRHQVLADNIANIDTPGYRARDLGVIEFDATLTRAIERSRRANPNISKLRLPTPGEIERRDPSTRTRDAARLRSLVFHDHNDRSAEKLMVSVSKNRIRHDEAVGLLRSQIRILRAVIAENAGQT